MRARTAEGIGVLGLALMIGSAPAQFWTPFVVGLVLMAAGLLMGRE